MRVKVEMNSKGEVKAHRIEIPIQGGGGELGQHAVAGLVSLISNLKEMKTERELEQLLLMPRSQTDLTRSLWYVMKWQHGAGTLD